MIAILAAAVLAWTPGEPPHDGRWVQAVDAYTGPAGTRTMRWLAMKPCWPDSSPGFWQTTHGLIYLSDARIRAWRPAPPPAHPPRLAPMPKHNPPYAPCSYYAYPRTKP